MIVVTILFALLMAGLSVLAGIVAAVQTGRSDFSIAGVIAAFIFGMVITQALVPAYRREQDLADRRKAARDEAEVRAESERRTKFDRENIALYERTHQR